MVPIELKKEKLFQGFVQLLLFCLLLFSTAFSNTVYQKVVNIIDGDTVRLESGIVVRLIGVDAPEINHPVKPEQYFAKESMQFLKNLLQNKYVRLEYDADRVDKYGRLLAYLFLKDGTFVNAKIIKEGYGFAYTKYPFKYLEQFKSYEKQAKESKKGLWAGQGIKEYKWLIKKDVPYIILYPMAGNYWTIKYKNYILPHVTNDKLVEVVDWVKYKAIEFVDEDLEKELLSKGWYKEN